jgi:hypothetical protein
MPSTISEKAEELMQQMQATLAVQHNLLKELAEVLKDSPPPKQSTPH